MNNEKGYYGAYAVKHKRRRNLHRILIGLAAVVVFCTTYALILPAITLDSPDCGYEEHIHIENCYKTVLIEASPDADVGLHQAGAYPHR